MPDDENNLDYRGQRNMLLRTIFALGAGVILVSGIEKIAEDLSKSRPPEKRQPAHTSLPVRSFSVE